MLSRNTEKHYTLCIVCKKGISLATIVRLSGLHNAELLDIKPFEPGRDYALYQNIQGEISRQMPILFVLSESECRVVHNSAELNDVLALISITSSAKQETGQSV